MIKYSKIGRWTVMIEDGYVLRACHEANEGVWRTPYIMSKYGGWDIAYGCLTVSAVRSRLRRGTLIFH